MLCRPDRAVGSDGPISGTLHASCRICDSSESGHERQMVTLFLRDEAGAADGRTARLIRLVRVPAARSTDKRGTSLTDWLFRSPSGCFKRDTHSATNGVSSDFRPNEFRSTDSLLAIVCFFESHLPDTYPFIILLKDLLCDWLMDSLDASSPPLLSATTLLLDGLLRRLTLTAVVVTLLSSHEQLGLFPSSGSGFSRMASTCAAISSAGGGGVEAVTRQRFYGYCRVFDHRDNRFTYRVESHPIPDWLNLFVIVGQTQSVLRRVTYHRARKGFPTNPNGVSLRETALDAKS